MCVRHPRQLVWAPKYRKWALLGAILQRVRELLCEIVGHHGFEMEEWEVDMDHVPLYLSFRRGIRSVQW